MKKLTKELVLQALKKEVVSYDNETKKQQAEGYGNHLKPAHYRTVAGVFKVKECYFENYSGKYYFNPLELYATSYGWWSMLRVVNGKLVWNEYDYSQQTSKHQRALRQQMKILGIKPDLIISTRANMKFDFDEVKSEYATRLAKAIVAYEFCQKKNKEWRWEYINRLAKEMEQMEKAGVGITFTLEQLENALTEAREERAKALAYKKANRPDQEPRMTNKQLAVAEFQIAM